MYRENFPNMAYVFLANDLELSASQNYIPRDLWNSLFAELMAMAYELEKAGHLPPIRCAWQAWTEGRGLLACRDKLTLDWFRKAVTAVDLGAGIKFAAWSKKDLETLLTVSFYVPDSCPIAKEEVLRYLVEANELRGTFKLRSAVPQIAREPRDGAIRRGIYYRVNVDNTMLQSIRQLKGRLRLVFLEIQVFYGKAKITSTASSTPATASMDTATTAATTAAAPTPTSPPSSQGKSAGQAASSSLDQDDQDMACLLYTSDAADE